MKTYQEYLDIIKERERKIKDLELIEQNRIHAQHKDQKNVLICGCFSTSGGVAKFSFDYSVEIMGMMMQDFLEEFKGKVNK